MTKAQLLTCLAVAALLCGKVAFDVYGYRAACAELENRVVVDIFAANADEISALWETLGDHATMRDAVEAWLRSPKSAPHLEAPGPCRGQSATADERARLEPPAKAIATPAIEWQTEAAAWQSDRPLWLHIDGPNCPACEVEAHLFLDPDVVAAAATLACARLSIHEERAAAYRVTRIPTDVFVAPDRKTMVRRPDAPGTAAALAARLRARGLDRHQP